MNSIGHSDEVSFGNEEYVIGQWGKGHPCYRRAEKVAELCLCLSVSWNVELVKKEIKYLAETNFSL